MVQPDPTPHLERFASYQQAVQKFQWNITDQSSIADFICRRFASDAASRTGVIEVKERGFANSYSFGALNYLSDKFAFALAAASGITVSDRIAVILPQCVALPTTTTGKIKWKNLRDREIEARRTIG